jgi:hypothetical protein
MECKELVQLLLDDKLLFVIQKQLHQLLALPL